MDDIISFSLTIWEAAWRSKRILFGVPIGIVAVTVAIILFVPRLYRSEAAFVVEETSKADISAQILGIIGKLNGDAGGSDSPQFFADLATSRPTLDALLRIKPHATCGAAANQSLLNLMHATGATSAESLFYARRRLSKQLGSDVDTRTGMVSVSLEARCPAQAVELTDSLLALIDRASVERRMSLAKQRREFAEERANEADADLRHAEDALADFLTRNRSLGSPELRFESDRLQRRVSIETDVVTTLRREFETARIEEVNSTPTIAVVEPPSIPVEPSRPKRRVIAFIALVLSTILGLGAATMRTLTGPLPPDASNRLARMHDRTQLRIALWRSA